MGVDARRSTATSPRGGPVTGPSPGLAVGGPPVWGFPVWGAPVWRLPVTYPATGCAYGIASGAWSTVWQYGHRTARYRLSGARQRGRILS
jgi:hypothetical protein